MSGLFDPSTNPGDIYPGMSLGATSSTTTSSVVTQVFNFGAANAGMIVEVQVRDSSFTPLSNYSTANVIEAGAGQYVCGLNLSLPFVGYAIGRLQAQPTVIDVYPINLGSNTAQALILANISTQVSLLSADPTNPPSRFKDVQLNLVQPRS